jgi:uncharacterized protein YkwD
VAVALAAVLLISSCATGSEQREGFDLVNGDRSSNGVPTVMQDAMLQNKAQAWAERLAGENRLAHSTLTDGLSGCWRGVGENVGYGGSVAEIERNYMASPGHRANILNRNFNRAAVGVAHRGDRVFTVQVFLQSC